MRVMTAADEIERRRERPVAASRVELQRADGVSLRADESAGAHGGGELGVQRESEEEENGWEQKCFHANRYGAAARGVALLPLQHHGHAHPARREPSFSYAILFEPIH